MTRAMNRAIHWWCLQENRTYWYNYTCTAKITLLKHAFNIPTLPKVTLSSNLHFLKSLSPTRAYTRAFPCTRVVLRLLSHSILQFRGGSNYNHPPNMLTLCRLVPSSGILSESVSDSSPTGEANFLDGDLTHSLQSLRLHSHWDKSYVHMHGQEGSASIYMYQSMSQSNYTG